MTPRTVVFSLPYRMTVQEFFHKHDNIRFSRIPVHGDERENVIGFVLRADLLLAQARGNLDKMLQEYRREMHAIPEFISVAKAFEQCLQMRAHIMLVVDEYGGIEGVLSLEDLVETLLGEEIVDEGDYIDDMQRLARRLAKRKNRLEQSS
jgi:CBS domain containing-hemolysin-like protein